MRVSQTFTYPEQIAIAELLFLIWQKEIRIINFDFFNEIRSNKLKIIKVPLKREHNKDTDEPKTPYLELEIDFYCRGKKVAIVTMEGFLRHHGGNKKDPQYWRIDFWRTAKIFARKYFWRDDDKDKTWNQFESQQTCYSSIKNCSDKEKRTFYAKIEMVINEENL